MIDFSSHDPRLLDSIGLIVDEIVRQAQVDADRLMVIGAVARDVIHSSLGHAAPLRATHDADLAIAMDDYSAFAGIDATFTRLSHTGIRYSIAGVPVDVMPFGGIEDPAGVASPSPRNEELSVFGFADVFAAAATVALPTGVDVRIPTPAGYAVLKARAWIDRSPTGEYKDAQDLATCLWWYSESEAITEMLWSTESETRLLESVDFQVERAAARVLGRDMRAILHPAHTSDLIERWGALDLQRLVRELKTPAGINWITDPATREAIAADMIAGLRGE